MTDDKKGRDNYTIFEDNSPVLVLFLSIAGICLILLPFVVPTIVLLEGSGERRTTLYCSLHEDSNQYMKDRWVMSENISSYEDIPEGERKNLSAEAREWLKSEHKVRDYNPIIYTNLSQESQNTFKKAINYTIVYNESNNFLSNDLTDLNLVFYNKNVYYCSINKPHTGA